MYRRVSLTCAFVTLACLLSTLAAQAETLQWDHPTPNNVSGYIVSVDGVRTDHGLSVASSNGSCACSLSLTLTPGQHVVVVSAYNSVGETASSPLTIDIPGGSTPPPPPPSSSPLPAPWLTQDIGAVGATGSASLSGSVYTVTGSGADIWGTSDGFRYVYQPLGGAGTIVARVTSVQNTNPWAKAGVMIRETNDASSAHALLNLRPNGVIEFLTRSRSGGETALTGQTTQAAPVWLKLSRSGSQLTAAMSQNGASWTPVGSIAIDMATNVSIGLAVNAHVAGTLNTSTFDGVQITADTTTTPPPTNPPPPPDPGTAVPSPWTSQDVGNTGLSGSASFSTGTFTLAGAGADVWGSADAFQYVWRPFTGDGSITTRVVQMEDTGKFAKAGLMLRGSLDASAADVVLDVTPSGNVEFMSRNAPGAATAYLAGAGQTPPAWLRLTRTGNTVTAFVSANGSSWNTVGAIDVASLTQAGLFVSSHDETVRNTSVFDSVSAAASAGGGGTVSASDVVIYAADVPGSAVHGGWALQPSASGAANMKLVSSDAGASSLSTPLAEPRDYVDVSFDAVAGTPYALWLRLRAGGNSKYNDSVWVQFSGARVGGSPTFGLNSDSGLLVNLATDSSGSSLSGWGWQNGAYWFSQPAAVTFATSGRQTLRIQVREDGVELDQIVLSPSRYLTQAPGSSSNDGTIVRKP